MTPFNTRILHTGHLPGAFQGPPSIGLSTPFPADESGNAFIPMPPGLVIAELIALRDELLIETNRYAQQPGAKQFYLDRRNDCLRRLSECIDSLQCTHYPDLWASCDAGVQAVRNRDPSIDSVLIRVDWASNPSSTAFIHRDLSYHS